MAKDKTYKKKIIYQETYQKGVTYPKNEIIKHINACDNVFLVKAGKYEDGKEFLIITIDNI